MLFVKFIGAALLLGLASFCPQPLTVGGDGEVPGTTADSRGTIYSLDDMLSKVGSIYGAEIADNIKSLTDPDTGEVTVGELYIPDSGKGVSDEDTILINTRDFFAPKMSLTSAAMVLVHEYNHCVSRRSQDPPTRQDPETNALPCGSCVHSEQFVTDAMPVTALCEVSPHPTGQERADICEAVKLAADAAYNALDECWSEGCPDSDSAVDALDTLILVLFNCCT